MTFPLGWPDIVLRLGLTMLACACIGFNRQEHRLAAGLRTTLLVGLAAAISMIQVNLLLNTTGKAGNSFVVLDLMRLPLGILSGMGFIGAGAILRRDNAVLGVTTAATLWFITVIGLCFGGGQIGLGVCAGGLGYATLTGLKHLEYHCRRDHRASLVLSGQFDHRQIAQIVQIIREAGFIITLPSITLAENNVASELSYELQWYGHAAGGEPPGFLKHLTGEFCISKMKWLVIA